jgi:hypothetical protein
VRSGIARVRARGDGPFPGEPAEILFKEHNHTRYDNG